MSAIVTCIFEVEDLEAVKEIFLKAGAGTDKVHVSESSATLHRSAFRGYLDLVVSKKNIKYDEDDSGKLDNYFKAPVEQYIKQHYPIAVAERKLKEHGFTASGITKDQKGNLSVTLTRY